MKLRHVSHTSGFTFLKITSQNALDSLVNLGLLCVHSHDLRWHVACRHITDGTTNIMLRSSCLTKTIVFSGHRA